MNQDQATEEQALFYVINDGARIKATNYFDLMIAKKGYMHLSINVGCFRLLAPKRSNFHLFEVAKTTLAIVSRGPWKEQGERDAIEILFEDYSVNPYVVTLTAAQADLIPSIDDQDSTSIAPRWKLMVYTENGLVHECAARYRTADRIPYLREWQK